MCDIAIFSEEHEPAARRVWNLYRVSAIGTRASEGPKPISCAEISLDQVPCFFAGLDPF